MQYTKAFFIKLAMTIVMLWIVLGLFFGVSFGNILLIGAILTIVAFLGDVFVLPKVGNITAAAGDFLLAFFSVWALGAILFGQSLAVFSAAFLSALFIGAGELFYHRYFKDHVMEKGQEPQKNRVYNYRTGATQTEFSHDFDEHQEKKENSEVTNKETEGPAK